jgi:hypothetical protein
MKVEETVRWAELEAEAARDAAADARRARSRRQAKALAAGLAEVERVRAVAVITAGCPRHRPSKVWDCGDCWTVKR